MNRHQYNALRNTVERFVSEDAPKEQEKLVADVEAKGKAIEAARKPHQAKIAVISRKVDALLKQQRELETAMLDDPAYKAAKKEYDKAAEKLRAQRSNDQQKHYQVSRNMMDEAVLSKSIDLPAFLTRLRAELDKASSGD
jgi:hypothetical protein